MPHNRPDVGSTDDGLVAGVQSHDQQAWARFVDEYSALIYVWCRSCDLQPADALDVSQQVFHAVSRSVSKFSSRHGQGNFRGWLFVVTKNQIRNHLARTLRGPQAQGGTSVQLRLLEAPDSIDELDLSNDALSAERVPSACRPVEAILEAAREQFEERTWQCFWLTAIEGHAAVDVAERLGMKPAAVRQAKYRVTQRLRRQLDDPE